MVTQAANSDPVKATGDPFRALVAEGTFPILAVAADAERGGTVCLTSALRAFAPKLLPFRYRWTRAAKVALALEHVKNEIEERAPALLVVERGFRGQLGPVAREIARLAARYARDRGIRVVCMSIAHASERVLRARDERGKPTFRKAVAALLPRYPPLAACLAPQGRTRLRDASCWRRFRSFSAVFCLAHAAALDAWAATTRGRAGLPPNHSL